MNSHQVELLAGEPDGLAATRSPRALDGSIVRVSNRERLVAAIGSVVPVRRSTARTRATTSRGENGFVDVVVGSQVEPHDAVRLLTTGGEHDDRHLGECSAMRTNTSNPSIRGSIRSNSTRSVRRLASYRSSACAPSPAVHDAEALRLEVAREHLAHHRLVVDHQHLRHGGLMHPPWWTSCVAKLLTRVPDRIMSGFRKERVRFTAAHDRCDPAGAERGGERCRGCSSACPLASGPIVVDNGSTDGSGIDRGASSARRSCSSPCPRVRVPHASRASTASTADIVCSWTATPRSTRGRSPAVADPVHVGDADLVLGTRAAEPRRLAPARSPRQPRRSPGRSGAAPASR